MGDDDPHHQRSELLQRVVEPGAGRELHLYRDGRLVPTKRGGLLRPDGVRASGLDRARVSEPLAVRSDQKTNQLHGYRFETVLLPLFATQMLAPSKATPGGGAHGEGAEVGPVARPQLRHVVAAVVRHPDVGAVEGHAVGVVPTGKVPRLVPSLARSFVTLLLP